jgi:hypothetical protein
MKTLYHGTSSRNLSSIRAIGIVPGRAKGGDAWAAANGRVTLAALSKRREPSVFLADAVDEAEYFARKSVEEMGGDPIVITVHVPEHLFAKFVPDELYHQSEASPHAWRAHRVDAEYVAEVVPVPPADRATLLMQAFEQLFAAVSEREEELA